jgi:hypothetical protein
MLVVVDLDKGGWWKAHEGRDTPEEQFVNAWDLGNPLGPGSGNRYWILEFPPIPPMKGGSDGQ